MIDETSNERESSATEEDPAALLPWYVNGTLSAADRERVETYLENHPEARSELELLRQMVARGRENQPEPPGELGLQRLRRDIRRQNTAGDGPIAGWWRTVAVAASLLLAVESAYLVWPGEPAEYRPAAGKAVADIQITFVAATSEQSIRTLLQEIEAEIVAGPGKLGVYHLALGRRADIDQVLAELRARERVVSHASRT